MSLATVQQLVDDLVRDTDQVITSTQRDSAIDNALARYGVDAPRQVVEDVTAATAGELPLPSAWTERQSDIVSAEYPIGERPPSMVATAAIAVLATPDGDVITLDVDSGAVVRLAYTAAHELDADTDTIPTRHRYAVACLAAADLCGQLAAYYANEGAPVIGADSVDHKAKSDRWRARMRDLLRNYGDIVGAKPNERNAPAGVDVQLARRDSRGRARIFHPPGADA